MERSGPTSLAPQSGESDSWLAFLEEHGLLNRLGFPGSPTTIVAPARDLWDWRPHRVPPKEVFQLRLVGNIDQQSSEGLWEPPKTPADFLAALRRQRARAHAVQIRVGSFTLPTALRNIADAIEESRYIRDLRDDWDADGSPGYGEATWSRAARLVAESSMAFWRTYRSVPSAPSITPGPDGSIDMVWRSAERKLVINVPEEPDSVATFYGKDRSNEHEFLRGEIDLSRDGAWLLAWLTR